MKVTHLGHAGLMVETGGATVLADPWFSPEGAFLASWFQYPENSHLITASLFEPTAIIISHEHLDHLDPWFLAQVPSHVPVIIPGYPSPVLRQKILSVGDRNIIEVHGGEEIDLCGVGSLYFVPEESPANHDNTMVIQADGRILVNMNDARLSTAQLRQIRARVGGTIDLLCLQGAGASWYPMCYEYSDDRRQELSRRKRLTKLAYVASVIRAANPVTTFPFAGPPCFLDADLFRHNAEMESGIFPDQQQVQEWLAKRGITNTVVLMPGDAWNLKTRTKDPDPKWADFSFSDRWPYLRAYAERRRPYIEAVWARHPEPAKSLWEPFREYFERLLTLSPYFNEKIGMRVEFDITGPGGGKWAVDFRRGSEGVCAEPGDCAYRYRFASRWLPSLLTGTLAWEDFLLSLRFEAWREPDLYNDYLLGLLKFPHPEALDALQKFETSLSIEDRITISAEGRTYRVQRHCPHGGLDLRESGEVLPGRILLCLGHHYEFDLETGQCTNGSCSPLITERVE